MSVGNRGVILSMLVALSLSLAWAENSAQNSEKKSPAGKPATDKRKGTKEEKSAKEGPEKLWLDRAEWLTLEIREEEWRVREQRPLLLARLAEAWWKYDTRRAKNWMESAVGELEFQPQNERPADLRNRIEN